MDKREEIIKLLEDSKLNSSELLEIVERTYQLWNIRSLEEMEGNKNEDWMHKCLKRMI